jgi:8-oxo-dGTP diphosphatase
MKQGEASVVIVVDGDKVLILKRSKGSSYPGFWNFPGGSVEPWEEFIDAGVRELKEESNIDVKKEDLKYIGTKHLPKLNIHFYITDKFKNEVAINKESDDYAWPAMSDIDNYLFIGGGVLESEIRQAIKNYMK